ncbi:uncharacterized protein LOC122245628 [Penaeus japonicus]|uniref:uncharacterized protein LOC122245628 n=1 Tax=Penaeus japonicus TaxID=27405 RepID=UPI001C71207F|nr:uncharacterized protein LOC122245628 [Penaeus japonicus]
MRAITITLVIAVAFVVSAEHDTVSAEHDTDETHQVRVKREEGDLTNDMEHSMADFDDGGLFIQVRQVVNLGSSCCCGSSCCGNCCHRNGQNCDSADNSNSTEQP